MARLANIGCIECSSITILVGDTSEFIITLGIGVAILLATTSVVMVMPVDAVTDVTSEPQLDPMTSGEGSAVFGTMLLHTSASACSSFVFSSGILGVIGVEVQVLVVGVVVVRLMHVLIEGIIGIIGMTTGRYFMLIDVLTETQLYSLVTCG